MEGCFTFQWGWGACFFRWGASFVSGRGWAPPPHGGIGFDGGFSKKIIGWEGAPPNAPSTMGNPEAENWHSL